MELTVKEMEILCIFHKGTLAGTLELLHNIEVAGSEMPERTDDVKSLVRKLSGMEKGEKVYLCFE
jgi:hypothetical protein